MASSKLKASGNLPLEDLELDMSPMIDLVFLLLIFFMVASTIIIVPIDADVKPPIATSALPQEDQTGRILINIRADGTITGMNPDEPLAGPEGTLEEVESYIAKQSDEVIEAGFKPKLHVRADKDVDVKRIREVVEAGANNQVIDVIFASFADPNKYQ